jgi:hypothetical protein
MKIRWKEVSVLALMALTALAVRSAAGMFAPTDIDMMADTDGSLVFQDPLQKIIADPEFTFRANGTVLVPTALYDVTGVVLGKKRYLPWGEYHFAPWDIGLGWRSMSNPETLRHVSVWQAARVMYFRSGANASVSEDELVVNMGNTHVIPANDEVRKKLADIRKGELVRLSGFLVNVLDGDQVYKSSLSRADTGSGAGEILYVQDVDLNPV